MRKILETVMEQDIFKPASKEQQKDRDVLKHMEKFPAVNLDDIAWLEGIAPGYEDEIAELLQFYYDQGKRAGEDVR